MAETTQTCPSNNTLASSKISSPELISAKKSQSSASLYLVKYETVVFSPWLLLTILSIKLHSLNGKRRVEVFQRCTQNCFRVRIVLFEIQSINTQQSEVLLYPLTLGENEAQRGHRSHTSRPQNPHPPTHPQTD